VPVQGCTVPFTFTFLSRETRRSFEKCVLLCYYAASSGNFLAPFRRRPIGPICRGEDSLCNNPEQRSYHLPRGESLKPNDQVIYQTTRFYTRTATRFSLKRQSSAQYYKNFKTTYSIMQLCSCNNWDPTQRTQLHRIISYLKSFCNVGLIMVFFGLKQVVIKFTLEQGTKAQRRGGGCRGTALLFL
jgi:hypothetical protein